MNWHDYNRGYGDGMDDYRSRSNNSNLLITLLQFAFSIVILLLQLSWRLVKEFLGLLWTIIRLIAGGKL